MRLPWSSMFQAMAVGSMASVLNVRVAVPLNHGDVIRLGEHALELRVLSATTHPVRQVESRSTVSISNPITMALVVGDLINFSTVSEQADHQVLGPDIDVLYSELRKLLNAHRGTLVDYVGDAFFAGWELDVDADAPAKALSYGLAAAELVSELTPTFELRNVDGSPLRMGWGITMGSVIMQLMPGAVVMVLGDAVNFGVPDLEHCRPRRASTDSRHRKCAPSRRRVVRLR